MLDFSSKSIHLKSHFTLNSIRNKTWKTGTLSYYTHCDCTFYQCSMHFLYTRVCGTYNNDDFCCLQIKKPFVGGCRSTTFITHDDKARKKKIIIMILNIELKSSPIYFLYDNLPLILEKLQKYISNRMHKLHLFSSFCKIR